ncbi:hypothetical protein AJ79_05257 [Helicocarpus griseus UAMH5409]|uniref:SPT2 chromatin protein n=1 Tax=Helicocarpus griseus UAMH5409 TaxID=1447875 RepID=A0A2B7XGD3_9EURO|nr:hypothetical protein AJ79_05257 [Helicocarpus griseus UAMH5409]
MTSFQFLNSVLSSIETGDKTPAAPPAPRNPARGPATHVSKPSSTPSSTAQTNASPTVGLKRRAEDDVRAAGKPQKVSRSSSPQRPTPQKSTSTPAATAKPRSAAKPGIPDRSTAKAPPANAPKNGTPPTATPAKQPPKGSYAEMMLRAKALQEKAPMQVGMIKHHSVSKEKQLQQKRKAEEARQKAAEEERNKKNGVTPKPSNTNGQAQKTSAARAALLKSRGESEYKGTARPPPSATEYKGTSGLPSRRPPGHGSGYGRGSGKGSRKPVRDEYLGTDEEDEGDFYDDGEGYYSDESTDMEAGIMDVEEEEQRALRMAKLEDEKELQAEMAAKREKMERKKKLAALAKNRR